MSITINGNGTVTGISQGGLPDDCIQTDDIASLVASKLTGTIATAQFPATLPAVSAANLTNIPAANLTGDLPAINGSLLTGISSSTVAFYAKQYTYHNASNTTYTKMANLSGDQVTLNTGSSWANSRFTVASGQEGKYFLFGSAGIDDLQREDIVNTRIYKNGSNTNTYVSERSHYSPSDSTPNVIVGAGPYCIILDLAVGDYVELYAYHNVGSTQQTEESLTYFGGFKL